MKKILITGSTGLLGINAVSFFLKNYHVAAVINNRNLDLANTNLKKYFLQDQSLKSIVLDFEPDIVINCAGLTDVNYCEKNPLLAELLNCSLTGDLAKLSKEVSAIFIQISTDHLWNDNDMFIEETHKPFPINQYAKSKYCAEIMTTEIDPESIIIRTNFFGWGPSYRPSFSDYIISHLEKNSKIDLYGDVFFTPIYIFDLLKIIENLFNIQASGIFNVSGSERLSKYEFGLLISKKFNLDSNLINKLHYAEINSSTQRPLEMSLSNNKVLNKLGIKKEVLFCKQMLESLFNDRDMKSYY